MRDEFVRRRAWLDDKELVDILGVSSLIPGPTSTEMAMHIGHRRAGWPGLFAAGLAFLLPAVLIVGVLAWAYVTYGDRPEVGAILAGVAPVVVAIIAHAGIAIARTALRTPVAIALGGAAVVGSLAGASEIALLLGLGLVSLVVAEVVRLGAGGAAAAASGLGGVVAVVAAAVAATPLAIFLEFFKIGTVLFGSGYVMVAVLRSELVEGLGWITEAQLVDAIAVGAATPGPLFSTATFIGYLVAGPIGAVAATVGIFLPAFIAVAISIPLLDRLRRSARARAFLDGVNAAAVGLLAVVAWRLGVATFTDPVAIIISFSALALLIRGVGSGWLIAGGAAIGLIRHLATTMGVPAS